MNKDNNRHGDPDTTLSGLMPDTDIGIVPISGTNTRH